MRFTCKLPALTFAVAAIALLSAASLVAAAQSPGRVVLVLPFDNRSGNTSLAWIGDSFPDTLNKRLASAGFLTISRDDRAFALDHLGLPVDFRPSRATTIRIAQQLDADFVVVGSFNVTDNKIAVQSQVLTVDALHLSAPLQDGADLPRLFDAENAIAWKIARQLDPHFNVAEQTFLAAPGAVPLPSFENYIRGTGAATPVERLRRLSAAVADTPTYAAALLALGKEQYAAHDYPSAAATLAKVPPADPVALEANFYLGLALFNLTHYAQAESAFAFVAARLPLPEVVNDQGVAAARQNKDAVAILQRASAADPGEEDYRYNLAVALYRRGDIASAKAEADAAIKLKPADSEAMELRARLNLAAPGVRPAADAPNAFSPVERIRRTYSETGFRQAAFQLDQVRAMRFAALPAAQQIVEYTQTGNDYLAQGLLPEAEQEFSTAISLAANDTDPAPAAAHAGLAQVRMQSNAATDARSEAVLSNKLRPNAAAWLVLARLDLNQGLAGAASDDVDQALRLEPKNSAALALQLSLRSRQP